MAVLHFHQPPLKDYGYDDDEHGHINDDDDDNHDDDYDAILKSVGQSSQFIDDLFVWEFALVQ